MEPLNLGLDLGMGSIKIYANGAPYLVPSQIAVNGASRVVAMTGLQTARPPVRVALNTAQSYYIGSGAHAWGRPLEALDYARLAGAPEFNALVLGALTRFVVGDNNMPLAENLNAPLRVTIGLPIEMARGDAADANVSAIKAALRGEHHLRIDDVAHVLRIADVRAASQASGALYDFLRDEDGAVHQTARPYLKSEIGVVSVGFNTVELMVIQDLQVVQRFTAGATVGVRRLLELVNGEKLYSLAELDERLRAHRLDVSAALPVWEREVSGFIESVWGASWRRFGVILPVGGGAVLLENALAKKFAGKAIPCTDPVFSIARGLYKLGLTQARRGK